MKLSTVQVREIVTDVEVRYPVETWVLDGVRIWPLLRVQLYLDLFFAGRSAEELMSGARVSRFARRGLGSLLSRARSAGAARADSAHNAEIAKADVVFLSQSSHRTLFGESWYDRYCDPFIEALSSLGKRGLLLEMALDGRYRVPRQLPSRFIQPEIDAVIRRSLLRACVSSQKGSLDGYRDLRAFLAALDVGANIPEFWKLKAKMATVFGLARFFAGVLNRARPSVVFVADFYSIYGLSLILACRRLGIPSVDIQHGTQGEDHLAYGSYQKVPDGGYEVLPSIFWCWGEFEAAAISRWSERSSGAHRPYVGGNLWMNIWRDGTSPVVAGYDAVVEALKKKSGRTVFVLFTPSLTSDLHEWVFDAIAASPPDLAWWIRAHPERPEQREIVREQIARRSLGNVQTDEPSALPLLALLRHADVNITAFSTTVEEADSLGVPTVLIDPAGLSLFQRQISSGTATTAFTAGDLLEAVQRQARRVRTSASGTWNALPDNVLAVRRFLESVHAPGARPC